MSYKTYSEYVSSELKWFDKIPKDWDIRPIKHLAKTIPGGTPSTSNLDYWENGNIPWLPSGMVQNCIIYEEDAFKFITEKGLQNSATKNIGPYSVLIALTGATCANIGYLTFKATANQSVISIEPYDFFAKYIYYALLSQREQILDKKTGGAQSGINEDDVKNILIPTMSLEEQTQIANYLDKQTTKIDETIVKNQELIELLEEKRVTLINQVVTKGLNPNVTMKDSGVKWIGEIPEHWEIKRLKYNCDVNPTTKKSVSNENLRINFLPMEKVSEEGWYDLESIAPYSSISKGYTYFEDDDVLVAKITPCFENGKSALLKNLKYGFGFGSTEFHVLRFRNNILPEFIYYLIKSYAFRTIGQAFMHGTAGQKRVGTDFIENYMMVTPPIGEQKDIVDYLDNEIDRITNTISKIKENIVLLEEYKTSLIHHVITGKIDVRGEKI